MFLAGVAWHEIEDHVHVAPVGGVEQRNEIVVGAVA